MDKTHKGDYRSAVSNTDERVTEGHQSSHVIPDACDAHALLREGVAARPMSCARRIPRRGTPERTSVRFRTIQVCQRTCHLRFGKLSNTDEKPLRVIHSTQT